MRLNCRVHNIKVTKGYDIFLHILEDDKPVYSTSQNPDLDGNLRVGQLCEVWNGAIFVSMIF